MATRLYLPDTGAAPVTPAFSAGWHSNAGADRISAVLVRINSAFASKSANQLSGGPKFILLRQYITDPLDAQTISGTLKGQIRGLENNANLNATVAINVKVVSNDGLTDKATLINLAASDSAITPPELSTVLTNRRFLNASEVAAIPISSFACSVGDRLVIEIGYRENDTTTNTARNASLNFGDASGTDLPENDTSTVANNPWIEFSNSLLFVQDRTITGKANLIAARYWVGGAGNWNDTAHWSISSGGAGGASVPDLTTNVFFDGNSGTGIVTVNVTATVRELNFTGYTGTFAGSATLNVYGNLTLGAGMTRTFTGNITFLGSLSITSNGVVLASSITFNNVGGTYNLVDALNNGSSTITLGGGTLNTNNQTVTCGSFVSTSGNTRALNLGSSTWNGNSWNVSSSNLTLNAGTSQINLSSVFIGGAKTYFNVTVNSTVSGSVNTLGDGGNTFNNLTLMNSGSSTNLTMTVAGNQTITGTLTIAGRTTDLGRIFVRSSTIGTARIFTAATVALSNTDLMDITGAGAATWSGSSLGDGGGNSGITFTTPVTRYWVLNGGNWSDTSHWSNSSGGLGGATVPLIHDTVIFDSNSFLLASQTITANMMGAGKDITFTGVTNNPTLNFSSTQGVSIFGSLTLTSGMTRSGSQALNFYGRGSQTFETGGLSFANQLRFHNFGGSMTLQNSITNTSTVEINNGTFDANDFNVQGSTIFNTSSQTTVINMGAGTWTVIASSGTAWSFPSTNITINAETSTLKFNGSGTLAKSVVLRSDNGNTFNIVQIDADNVQFSNGATIGTLYFNNPSKTTRFQAGKTFIVTTFTATGTSGNLITINSLTPGTPFTFSKPSGTVISDYLHLTDSTASGGAEWYAGSHSTDNGGNTGWIFKDVTTRTQTGRAKLFASTTRIAVGRASIKRTVAATITGKARIKRTISQTQPGVARIRAQVSRTITGRARIKQIVTRTQSGKANLFNNTSRTQSGKASIKSTTSRTITGNSRIQARLSQTLNGTARIQEPHINRTISGVASIFKTVTRTITGKANIFKVVTRDQTGTARLVHTTSRNQTGRSRITNTTSQTQTGKAKITAHTTRTQTGKGNIFNTTTRTQSGKARILQRVSSTITGKSNLLPNYVNIIDDASNFGAMPGSGHQLVRTAAGVLYAVLCKSTVIEVWKSTNEGSTWSRQDNAHQPGCFTSSPVAAAIDGNDLIHIVYRDNDTNGRITYNTFTPSTDLWGTEEFFTAPTQQAVNPGFDIAVDSNNKPHLVGIQRTLNFDSLYYSQRTTGSWATVTLIEGFSTSKQCMNPSILIDNNNKPQVAYLQSTDTTVKAAIGNQNAATSFTLKSLDAGGKGSNTNQISIAMDTSNNTWVTYINSSDDLKIIEHLAADAWSTWQSAVSIDSTNNLGNACLIMDGTNRYVFAVDTGDSDIYMYKNSLPRLKINTGTLQQPHGKWAFYSDNNTNPRSVVEYLFSDGTDVYYGSIRITPRTQTGKARINTDAVNLILGKASIKRTVTTTQTGKARITAQPPRTQTGKARVKQTASSTQTGKARIMLVTTRTQTGTSRVEYSVSRPQTGRAKITNTTSRTQSGTARILKVVTQTQDGTSRIQKTVSRSVDGVSRVTAESTQTQTGKARVQKTVSTTQTGLARVANVIDRNQTGRSSILVVLDHDIQGAARIIKSVSRTQTGVADIFKETTRTQTGAAKIYVDFDTTSRVIAGSARIENLGVLRTQPGKSKIFNDRVTTTRNQTGTARLGYLNEQSITGRAVIVARVYPFLRKINPFRKKTRIFTPFPRGD